NCSAKTMFRAEISPLGMRCTGYRKLAFDRFECHFLGLVSRLALPGGKQLSVRVLEIAFHRDIEPPGSGVNPSRLSLDFAKVADGRLVNYHMASGVAPFTTVLLIAEAGIEANG